MSQKRTRSQSPDGNGVAASSIYKSEPIKDRSSTFIAAFIPHLESSAPIAKHSSIPQSAKNLQSLPDFDTATHKIAAWRLPSTQKSLTPSRPVYSMGHDDDGESHAGRKLGALLGTQNAVGCIVVARWYGGVMLGPVRFDHIEDCAKEAIENCREETERERKRRRKEVDDRAKKEGLVRALGQRDESIATLRGFLAEKQGKAGYGKGGGKPAVQYDEMPLETLVKLETARDKTLSWILKELDKLDEQAGVPGVEKGAEETVGSGAKCEELNSTDADAAETGTGTDVNTNGRLGKAD